METGLSWPCKLFIGYTNFYLYRPGLPHQNVWCFFARCFIRSRSDTQILDTSCTTNTNPDSLRQWWWVVNLKMTVLPQYFLRFPWEFSLQDLGRSSPKNYKKGRSENGEHRIKLHIPALKANADRLGQLSWAIKYYCDKQASHNYKVLSFFACDVDHNVSTAYF